MKQPQQVFQCVDDTETSTVAEITAEAAHAQFHVLCNNLRRSKRVTARFIQVCTIYMSLCKRQLSDVRTRYIDRYLLFGTTGLGMQ